MKQSSTLKNVISRNILFLTTLLLSISSFGQTKHIVEVTRNKFTPANLIINKGDTVEWRNIEGFHNVNGTQDTYPLNPESFGNGTGTGWSFPWVFTLPGKYDYRCNPHFELGMVGNIEVIGASPMKHIVEVTKNKFTPAILKINVGDTVVWKNIEGFHNVNGTQTTYPLNPESFGNETGTGWEFPWVFTLPGKYDYRCNPHFELGMVGTIEVEGMNTLTVNFSGMNPHVDQTFWIALIDKNSGMEMERKSLTATVEFSVMFSGIEKDHSYNIDFFADHNKNGMYDAPPADHAWRMELNDVMGDTTLNFTHNTTFTDIMWMNKLTVHFMNMNPHVGQNFHLAVIDKTTGMELQRVSTVASVDFMVDVYGIENGMSYNVDFFADHNKNGKYDAPNADHAWRMELNDVMGDTMLMFTHNTSFTDISWKNRLTVQFMGMNPHVGQDFQLTVYEKTTGLEIQKVDTVAEANFMIYIYGIENGMSYSVDFFADHNKNGMYDAPPVDHAWRLDLNDVMGDTTLFFTHNTSFTDISIKTGIDKNVGSLVKMYPNPAIGKVTIETGDFNTADLFIFIYDITGKMWFSANKSFSNKFDIDLNQLVNGVYFIELKNSKNRKIMKLVKN